MIERQQPDVSLGFDEFKVLFAAWIAESESFNLTCFSQILASGPIAFRFFFLVLARHATGFMC